MMQKKFHLLLITGLLLAACNQRPTKTAMANNWMTSRSLEAVNAGDSLLQFPKVRSNSFLFSFTGSSVLNLNPDQTFTSLGIHQHFFYGKWGFNEHSRVLTLTTDADTCNLKVLKLEDEQLVLEGKIIDYLKKDYAKSLKARAAKKPDTLIKKITLAINHDYKSGGPADYFALKNNQWRIKPTSPETVAQINQRICGSLRFTIMYLTAHQKDSETDLQPIALPITIAVNGIQMQLPDDTRQEWKEIFYDSADATTAYNILNRSFYGNYNIPKENGYGSGYRSV
ncbi:hypothetical protein ACFGVR_11135 [Mucilaginibacter sp. AW1-3]